jgi:phospholipid transport system substrate-binding protein
LYAGVLGLLLQSAAAAEVSAEGFIRQKHVTLSSLLKQPKSAANETKIEAVFDGMLDYAALARESLGKHWAGLSEQQRDEFRSVLQQLVRRAHRKNLRSTLDYRVAYKGIQPRANGVFVVNTVAEHRTNRRKEPISIGWVMHPVVSNWGGLDSETEQESLMRTYRSQFGRIIRKHGFSGLLDRMKRKLNQRT